MAAVTGAFDDLPPDLLDLLSFLLPDFFECVLLSFFSLLEPDFFLLPDLGLADQLETVLLPLPPSFC